MLQSVPICMRNVRKKETLFDDQEKQEDALQLLIADV
jgi:hypothetical protein